MDNGSEVGGLRKNVINCSLNVTKFRSSFHLHRPKRSVDHPVFIAQHATATCCRECIRKWHKIKPGRELSQVQRDYLVDVIMTWIEKELNRAKETT